MAEMLIATLVVFWRLATLAEVRSIPPMAGIRTYTELPKACVVGEFAILLNRDKGDTAWICAEKK